MDARNKKRQKTYYNSQFAQYGYDPRSLGWRRGSQELRFENLAMIGELNGCSILDVGCGFGDLYGYLTGRGIEIKYTGIDINRNFIKTAREVYPDTHFIEADFEDDHIQGKFDWAFASGIFNLKMNDNQSFVEHILEKMFRISRKGIAADFLNADTAVRSSMLYYQDYDTLIQFCKKLSDHVVIRADYMPSDYCVYVYKNNEVDGITW